MKQFIRIFFGVLLFLPVFSVAQTGSNANVQLLQAAEKGDSASVAELLKKGASVNTTTFDEVTPLMLSAQNGHLGVIRLLLNNNAEIDKQDYAGMTALHLATLNRQGKAAEELILAGADMEKKDENKATPLLYATAYNYQMLADMLLYYGANPNNGRNGFTPLHLAAYDGNTALTGLLITYNADVNKATVSGYTPLMLAAQNGHFEVVNLLINYGAALEETSSTGKTALSCAAANGHKSVVDLLLTQQAKVNPETNWKSQPLTLAMLNRHRSLQKQLKEAGAKIPNKLFINKLSITTNMLFNTQDFFTGIDIGLHEQRFGSALYFGYQVRPFRKRIHVQKSEHTYYQFREWRSMFHLSFEQRIKNIDSYRFPQGFYIGVKEAFTFGNYTGTLQEVENKFLTIPFIGYYLSIDWFTMKLHYEYMDLNISHSSPHFFHFGTRFDININQFPVKNYEVKWL